MGDRPTRIRLDLRSHCTFEELPDGSWASHFSHLNLTGVGPTEEEAWQNLTQTLQETIGESKEDGQKWSGFLEEYGVREEIPEDELQERQATIDASHQASSGFRVLNASDFDEATSSPQPVLVDFWAEWCMPCHMLAPTLKEVADEFSGRMIVAKLNMDDNKEFWEKLGIDGIPTMILFANGQERFRLVGAGRSKAEIIRELEPHLG